ncbi:MAG: SMP-30/gluconolactonase/LRE family protein [Sulfuricaulis sp.]|uniref:SMP-30/gluconolactonase/LRE family protein n=1 Tax=Sulfuricaulis sp. TaxID=2003553 RepID=UPI0034A4C926
MKYLAKAIVIFTCSLLLAGAATADPDLIVKRNAAVNFATLPLDTRFPEGITANPANGDIYVATFDAPSPTNPNPNNKLLRFNRQGHLVAARDFGTDPLLGLAFDSANGQVYIANVGDFSGTGSRVQRIASNFNAATPIVNVANISVVDAPDARIVNNPDGSVDTITFGDNARVPNAMVLDSSGNLYVSDSFQGAIFRIDNVNGCATPCTMTTVKHDGLLATAGFPPFGANGLALNADESTLFIANTGDDRILTLDLVTLMVSEIPFAESINGADGVAMDSQGRLWVAANQGDEVVALNSTGRVIVKLGDFQGIRQDGSPKGLLFPASLVIVKKEIFVTNLALPLTGGDEPEADVTRYTVSRMKIPESDDHDDD